MVALTLRPIAGSPLPPWAPGAHVDLILGTGRRPGSTRCAATRPTTTCGGSASCATRTAAAARSSSTTGCAPATRSRSAGRATTSRSSDSPRYVFIAGGIGITPILPMIAGGAGGAAPTGTSLTAGRSRASHGVPRRARGIRGPGDRRPAGRDRSARPARDPRRTPQPDTLVYCCGPGPLLAAVEARVRRLAARGAARRAVRRPAAHCAGAVRELRGRAGGRAAGRSPSPPDRSILDAVDRARHRDVLSSCDEGTCGTCETRVLERRARPPRLGA